MNTLATIVHRILSENDQVSLGNQLALSAVEREAVERIALLLHGSKRRPTAAFSDLEINGAWHPVLDYNSITG